MKLLQSTVYLVYNKNKASGGWNILEKYSDVWEFKYLEPEFLTRGSPSYRFENERISW